VIDSNDPMTHVTLATYEDIVMDDTKDVIVLFYVDWCPACKEWKPDWISYAKEFANSPADFRQNGVIAMYNLSENEKPADLEIPHFPTIYMFPKTKKKEPVFYEAGHWN